MAYRLIDKPKKSTPTILYSDLQVQRSVRQIQFQAVPVGFILYASLQATVILASIRGILPILFEKSRKKLRWGK